MNKRKFLTRKQFENKGYKFVKQNPYQEYVEIEGQIVKLPYTNAYYEVVLHKSGGQWHYIERWEWFRRKEEFEKYSEMLMNLMNISDPILSKIEA
ncbi:hypothetical protein A2567_01755 [Candidatus Azambacteria bacterium RIFOXYD1_FULL_42_11]|uniref:Uncharacterized protein n=2 Tax=Candidatus Azamiibacteriota TaxID=1752741 RepID=A0A1F5CH40_9BACT|nr:MAG: hypothetical protein UV07_C0027G0010 [Candidatus Azambacteria bacterium GW2011_GWB1_42_17]KKS87878.1 MAG: hypothetical protein UV62_C0022G0010 [Parcubacteria group bacterium GW2011_GWC1_43_11]OGD42168.1 MAG: hypothetical protein A2567_01755 [Candidatus Azambacteria bacterium RIFOXYD1_FULL_42_11]